MSAPVSAKIEAPIKRQIGSWGARFFAAKALLQVSALQSDGSP